MDKNVVWNIIADSKIELRKALKLASKRENLRVLIIEVCEEKNFVEASEIDSEIVSLVEDFPAPTILILKEIVSGTLFDLLLVSNLCFATHDATFFVSEDCDLENEIGSKNFEKLGDIASEISAETAQDIGLINAALDLNELKSRSMDMAVKISELAPIAVRSSLEAVSRGAKLSLKEGLEFESALFSQIFSTEDMKEGTRAFFDKRKPDFKGK